jgi:hypothetical protein
MRRVPEREWPLEGELPGRAAAAVSALPMAGGRTKKRQSLVQALLSGVVMLGAVEVCIATERPDWTGLIVTTGSGAEMETQRAALIAALRLLPRLPARVAVIDAHEARPDVRPRLLALDAFVTKGSPVIYVVRQSALLQGAVAGSPVHTHALAAVLWHEMAHAEGSDEREARRREQSLWITFVRDQRVEVVSALRYLAALEGRSDDALLALHSGR